MPRVGLTPDGVVDAALALVDEGGVEAVSLSAVADAVGVRTPSLYRHVDSLADLHERLGARVLDDVVTACEVAVGERTGTEAVRVLMHAYRGWVHAHPRRHALVPVAAPVAGTATHTASERFVAVVSRWVAGLGLAGEDAVHAIRLARSALHGFCAVEAAGGFGLPADVDVSFARLVDLVADGLGRAAPGAAADLSG